MSMFNQPEHEKKLAKVQVILDEFMTTTVETMKVQNQKIETLTEICNILMGEVVEAQNKKIQAVKEMCDVLAEKSHTLEELVSANARNNVQMLADMDRLAKVLIEIAGEQKVLSNKMEGKID